MAEFAVSATAAAKGIKMVIPEAVKPNIVALVTKLLQPLCDATGWRDQVNSGYRSPEVNKLVGGVPTSQHLTGQASDNMFYTKTVDGVKYVRAVDVLRSLVASGLDFDQAIAYPTFVHLSYRAHGKNRRQVLYNKSYKGAKL